MLTSWLFGVRRRRMRRVAPPLALALLLASAAVAPARAQTVSLPAGPNRDLVYGKCRTCHSLQYPKDSAGITRQQWEGVLDDMGMYGLDITDAERGRILEYLATYLGPNPPPVPAREEASAAAPDGRQVFLQQCSACHQANGQGLVGQFPPLAGNRDLFRTRRFPVLVLLNGMQGPIEVSGGGFNGQMPAFDFLTDDEIVAVIRYVRGAWGNDRQRPRAMTEVDAQDVSAARQKPLQPHEVHAYRQAHGGK